MKKIVALLAGAMMMTAAVSAWATTINAGAETSLQQVLHDITQVTVDNPTGNSSVDALGPINDALGFDSYWSVDGSGGSISTIIIEIAGWAGNNTFGVYDKSTGNSVELFSGVASTGAQAMLGIADDGSVFKNMSDTGIDFAGNNFGFYLGGTNHPRWYSDSALNSDNQFDHMVAFQGNDQDVVKIGSWAAGLWSSNEYILAFEDTASGGDKDYNDFVMMVESVSPVPEPGTIVLLGAGLLGLGLYGRRRMQK